jgi:hypothetical protein
MCSSRYNKCLHSSVDISPVLVQMTQYIKPSRPGLLEVLFSHRCFCILEAISCLLSSGRHLLSRITSSLPLQALMSDPTRVVYQFGIFGQYSVGISWNLPNRYRRKTRSVHFGIIILVGTPFFLERGVMAPFLRGPAPILRKKGFPANP